MDVEHDEYEVDGISWGDDLKLWKNPIHTLLDKISERATIAIAPLSPVLSKVVNDGAYLRAMFGTVSIVLPLVGLATGLFGLTQIQDNLLVPAWQTLLLIAVLGVFDALAGFLGTVSFVIGAIAIHGIASENDLRLQIGILLIGFGPALLATAFRKIRKQADLGLSYWWERIIDLAVVTFLAGWTMSSMVSTLPALAGMTMPAANHVTDFSLAVAAAMFVRIVAEETASRVFTTRLNRINPTHVPGTNQIQKSIALLVRLGLFIFVSAALMGNTWQTWVGSILFILPTFLGWYSDKLPNFPILWKLLPSGVPGLALSLIIASTTTALVGAWLGATPDLAQWSFVLLPIPLLVLSVLGLFGRHGTNPEDPRPIKTDKWKLVYRIGGVVMLIITLRLAGIF